MLKYMRVMDGMRSSANGFVYKLDEVNVASHWNPLADNPEDFGGFNFSVENKILRWIIRGDTLYDVIIPPDAQVVSCENKNTPGGVFRSNKIIVTNPRLLTTALVMDLYLKSDLPINTYFQCLCFLSLRNYEEVCNKIIEDKVSVDNIEQAIHTFTSFLQVKEEEKSDCYRSVMNKLLTIQTKNEEEV